MVNEVQIFPFIFHMYCSYFGLSMLYFTEKLYAKENVWTTPTNYRFPFLIWIIRPFFLSVVSFKEYENILRWLHETRSKGRPSSIPPSPTLMQMMTWKHMFYEILLLFIENLNHIYKCMCKCVQIEGGKCSSK